MKFIWADGYQREVKAGNKVVGMHHHGKRPTELSLNEKDLRELLTHPTLKEYLYNITPALSIGN